MGIYNEKKIANSSTSDIIMNQDDEISLYDLWEVIIKRKMIIIVVLVISLFFAVGYSFVAEKIYRLETTIKIYTTKDLITVKDQPKTKIQISGENRELHEVIFKNNANDIKSVRIVDIAGTTDRAKVTIESSNRETLNVALQQLVNYIENVPENKVINNKIIAELNQKLDLVRAADKKGDAQISEIEKRINNTKVLSLGFNPIDINQKSIDLKMEKYRLENEVKNYKIIQLPDEPVISKYPIKPDRMKIITLACALGFMLGVFIVFVMAYFERMRTLSKNNNIKTNGSIVS